MSFSRYELQHRGHLPPEPADRTPPTCAPAAGSKTGCRWGPPGPVYSWGALKLHGLPVLCPQPPSFPLGVCQGGTRGWPGPSPMPLSFSTRHLPRARPWPLLPSVSTLRIGACEFLLHPRVEKSISRSIAHTMSAPYHPDPDCPLSPQALAQSSQNSLGFGDEPPVWAEVPRTGMLPMSHQGAPLSLFKYTGKQCT